MCELSAFLLRCREKCPGTEPTQKLPSFSSTVSGRHSHLENVPESDFLLGECSSLVQRRVRSLRVCLEYMPCPSVSIFLFVLETQHST